MIKVTFKEPCVIMNDDDLTLMSFISVFMFVKKVTFSNYHNKADFSLKDEILNVNDGAEYIKSIEHVKPTDL